MCLMVPDKSDEEHFFSGPFCDWHLNLRVSLLKTMKVFSCLQLTAWCFSLGACFIDFMCRFCSAFPQTLPSRPESSFLRWDPLCLCTNLHALMHTWCLIGHISCAQTSASLYTLGVVLNSELFSLFVKFWCNSSVQTLKPTERQAECWPTKWSQPRCRGVRSSLERRLWLLSDFIWRYWALTLQPVSSHGSSTPALQLLFNEFPKLSLRLLE